MKRSGFTLLELLVSMAIFSIIGLVLVQIFSSSGRLAKQATVYSGNLQDLQAAANIVADDVRRATDIRDEGETHPFASIAPGIPTNTGQYLLLTATPKPSESDCTTAYVLNGYYLTARKNFTTPSSIVTDYLLLTSGGTANDDNYVLMKLEGCASKSSTTWVYSDVRLRFVADNLTPATFTYTDAPSGLPSGITVSFASERIVRGSTVRVPPSGLVKVTGVARNIQ
ncbi:prepilin-type N-terminal cleavage/methylation domain-containing protein [Deinococcus pimensis]|uniref:prepilin-type N-terminal cleavage/methylation domain-containing protein n=1 Tax=Deinococcus pimensis TaxID=309888 RepID=UPI000488E39A|nr:prepilin-type N-terminal cleavage/methylation domain-containing protein [Deinococcus pimensis]